jgi:multiple sugar transport system permease protein
MKVVRVIATIFYTLFFAIPILWLLLTSIKSEIQIGSRDLIIFPDNPSWSNYEVAVTRSGIGRSAFNSFWLSAVSALITTLVTAPAAYLVAQSKGVLSRVTTGWILSSQVFPSLLTVIPLFLIYVKIGLYNNYIGAIILYVIFNLPFALWIQLGFVRNIPGEIIEAGRIDGASGLKLLKTIIFPLLLPGSIVVMIYTFINCWNNFLIAVVFLQGNEKQTLTTQMARFIGTEGQGLLGPLAAATVLSITPSLILFAVLQRKFSTNLISGSVKG